MVFPFVYLRPTFYSDQFGRAQPGEVTHRAWGPSQIPRGKNTEDQVCHGKFLSFRQGFASYHICTKKVLGVIRIERLSQRILAALPFFSCPSFVS